MTAPTVVSPATATPERPRPARWNRVRATYGRNWVFVTVFAAGAALRVATLLAYRPALLFIDSFKYLNNLDKLDPSGIDPIGYGWLFLRPVLSIGNLATVAATQHVIGLLMGVAIYAVLLRNGVRPWMAGLAAIPVLLDAYQLQIEQNVMSDTLFEALVLAGVVVVCWNRRPGYLALATAGALFGVAMTVRLVGIPLVIPLVVFAALTGAGWTRVRRGAVVALAFAIPVLGYASYYDDMTGRFAITTTDAGAIYGRAVVIVDCPSLSLPTYERVLCPKEPLGQRPGDRYAHDPALLARIKPPKGMTAFDVERDFALRVFVAQPLDFARSVLGDFAHGFDWSRTSGPTQVPVSRWQFQTAYPRFPHRDPVPFARRYGGGRPTVDRSLAQFLRDYQFSIGFVPGPFLALAFAAGLLGAFGFRRARRSGLQAACFLASTCGLGLLLTADMFEFSWRYQLPGLLLAPLAGALGVTALRTGSRQLLPAELDDVDQAAIAAFRARNGDVQLAPVAVVIAAYEEEDTIGLVLDELPAESCGLRIQPLVVVDGATDDTAEVARARGALVCPVEVNRGQGAALRLGYHLARTGGAHHRHHRRRRSVRRGRASSAARAARQRRGRLRHGFQVARAPRDDGPRPAGRLLVLRAARDLAHRPAGDRHVVRLSRDDGRRSGERDAPPTSVPVIGALDRGTRNGVSSLGMSDDDPHPDGGSKQEGQQPRVRDRLCPCAPRYMGTHPTPSPAMRVS